jgi:hypothetical protein
LRKSEGTISQKKKRQELIRLKNPMSIIKLRSIREKAIRYINPDVEP